MSRDRRLEYGCWSMEHQPTEVSEGPGTNQGGQQFTIAQSSMPRENCPSPGRTA